MSHCSFAMDVGGAKLHKIPFSLLYDMIDQAQIFTLPHAHDTQIKIILEQKWKNVNIFILNVRWKTHE